ncbi:membrane fusion protein, Cu(I)/Ag(I) efflux system [Verrucomicrobium sp. GAS474]|uniref:efflux RND transporter periplasmic adaptor subunit n=1 Tax=Verrucomicrobium sp. GAS474 TaxID=1882831 RepID=UPI00087C650E|nr:efflux RND transporter periplasmic adaptor subunit [Verrucomicrobium sp. GAS474]SDU02290.1 membrane fusion protein, Cu(I)/Ag(I) efflux system [Verrucomicrobium sp. GAS474]
MNPFPPLSVVPSRRRFLYGIGAGLALALAGCRERRTENPVADYTCAMHPEVRSHDPKGHCPICGMDLIPVASTAVSSASAATTKADPFTIPPERLAAIGVRTGTVERKRVAFPLRAPATLAYDEAGFRDINVKGGGGYVENLAANYVGKPVAKGERLMTVLVEDWIEAQKAYVAAWRARNRTGGAKFTQNAFAADQELERFRARLRIWDLSGAQIAELDRFAATVSEFDLRTGKGLKGTLDILSPVSGWVTEKSAVEGMRFEAGQSLLRLADLSTVWVEAAFDEAAARYVAPGTAFTVRVEALPDFQAEARVDYLAPGFAEGSRRRTARLRLANADGRLSPGMIASVESAVALGERLVVPASALLPTGTRQVAFLDKGEGRLEPRFVVAGARFGEEVEVVSGLAEGDRVITSANFLIDSESRIQGALRVFEGDENRGSEGNAGNEGRMP